MRLTRRGFLERYGLMAKRICGQHGIPASVCLAQAIIEGECGEQYITNHCKLITQDKRYESVMAVLSGKEGTLGEYIHTLADVYLSAEDDIQDYCKTLMTIINNGDLMQYDKRGVYLSARQGASFHGTDSDERCNTDNTVCQQSEA